MKAELIKEQIREQVSEMLQSFIETDISIYGYINESTIKVIDKQGYQITVTRKK